MTGRQEMEPTTTELKEWVVCFGSLWANQYAREFGFPDGHLHPTHYDILKRCGARMDDFVCANLDAK
jgi:hypothetical protein